MQSHWKDSSVIQKSSACKPSEYKNARELNGKVWRERTWYKSLILGAFNLKKLPKSLKTHPYLNYHYPSVLTAVAFTFFFWDNWVLYNLWINQISNCIFGVEICKPFETILNSKKKIQKKWKTTVFTVTQPDPFPFKRFLTFQTRCTSCPDEAAWRTSGRTGSRWCRARCWPWRPLLWRYADTTHIYTSARSILLPRKDTGLNTSANFQLPMLTE